MLNKMIKINQLLVVLAALAWAAVAAAQPMDDDPAAVQLWSDIESVLQRDCNGTTRIGMKVYSLERKTTLLSKNSNVLFTPASNMKMITSAMALKRVGPDYRFFTRLYTNGRIEGDTLKGDLFIKGFGDPWLVTEQMWVLVNGLRNLPIKKIEGNLIADNHFFEDQERVATWANYRGPEAYLAPMGALSFNFNTVTVYVEPAPVAGEPPVVVVDPATEYIRIHNTARTVGNRRDHERLIVNRLPRRGYDEIIVTGTLPKTMARKKYFLNVTDPQWYTLHVFRKYLEQAGVTVEGGLERGRVVDGARLLYEHESPPLADILRGLNKFSNNFIAEQILRTMAADVYGAPGTTENGVKLVKAYMRSLGFDDDRYNVVDGSGLSRQNMVSPDQIVAVLEDAYRDLAIFPEFIAALGVMGIDGSVIDRMNGIRDAQKIRAKTGTLNHVSALSGYFQSMDGERFAFSILLNDLNCSNGKAMKLEDDILDLALRFKRSGGADAGAPSNQKVETFPINP
ncbi:D-alanyl-D-alanine carboxypeptidase/D-alanyl-D-alanine-endopeptidase (penicillin-binding protein 4) [Nitrospina gracilis]|nr:MULTISPECIES: D-alanyl-D-alanine carboxypeptidase/D-alanyl-D-alanine-endopeptidase [Nitrospina]MCF8722448.1 D-alanyl-D-alanine carboxypeptidase/D-alanyl-D-alanine-endopeptidase (penicillin-binding protein 4) [Nitrospina sp. Nb-3]